MKRIATILVLIAGLAGLAPGQVYQTALTSTTLSAAITNSATNFCLASTSGVYAPVLGGSPVTTLYIDHEAMGVYQVNSTSGCVGVRRGDLGTKQGAHSSGTSVLISAEYQTTLAQGGNPASSGFIDHDAPIGATCVTAETYPTVNVLTGAQWICSTTSLTWVPGFDNPLSAVRPGLVSTTASTAGAQTIPGPYFALSGTAAITSFTIPVGMNAVSTVGWGNFCIYPTGAFTTTAGNNIAVSSTAVVGKLLCFTWNPTTAKFAASY